MNLSDQGLELSGTGKTAAQRVARQTPFHALEPILSNPAQGLGMTSVEPLASLTLLIDPEHIEAKRRAPIFYALTESLLLDKPLSNSNERLYSESGGLSSNPLPLLSNPLALLSKHGGLLSNPPGTGVRRGLAPQTSECIEAALAANSGVSGS